ncbi:MAG: hypothetical protein LAQ69_43290, partial [Acidobacteriia bacterium]|nr:hypothetical protein [Terriglobia bacterium]
MRTFGADDGKPPRTPAAWMISPAPLLPPKEHAFGVDDDPLSRIPVPSPVLGAGQFSQALLGHSCQAPKGMTITARPTGLGVMLNCLFVTDVAGEDITNAWKRFAGILTRSIASSGKQALTNSVPGMVLPSSRPSLICGGQIARLH